MLKRGFDFFLSLFGLVVFSPLLLLASFFIWLQDFKSPLYIAPRVGRGEKLFPMVKLRSMVVHADKSGVDSTSANDSRITVIGRIVRAYKLDELAQLWNVFVGHMSFVGPRPNVQRETDLYTPEEKKLLNVRPGITDLASIVFSDEGDILEGSEDPDVKYNQVIRPWKSRLALLYIGQESLWLDVRIIFLTAIAIVSRSKALGLVGKILQQLGADPDLCKVALRQEPLVPAPPPGASQIVTSRT